MGKIHRWQYLSIFAVALLTIYNILPTLFFYSKPLDQPLSKKEATRTISGIEQRIEHLSNDSLDWVNSFAKHIDVSPKTISTEGPSIRIEFSKASDAEKFRSYVPSALSRISFPPARLLPSFSVEDPNVVVLNRQVSSRPKDIFSWLEKGSASYQKMIIERGAQIAWNLIEGEKKGVNLPAIEEILTQDGSFSFKEKTSVFTSLHIDFSGERYIFSTKDKTSESFLNAVGTLHRSLNEKGVSTDVGYEILFHRLSGTSSLIAVHLDRLAENNLEEALQALKLKWVPKHPDLQNIPIVDRLSYEALSIEEKALCLLFVSPFSENLPKNSLYLFAKGLDRIQKTYEGFEGSPLAAAFEEDLEALHLALYETGFLRAPKMDKALFSEDFHFEKRDFAVPFLEATREQFFLNGDPTKAFLELSNHEHRILAENKIDNAIQEELIQWRDEYKSSQVSLDPKARFVVPKPPKNVLWNNLKLTFTKLLRGDEERIIRWGLDLSGGKSVDVALLDRQGNVISDDAEIKQGIEELSSRVNKMGLSEVSIRQVGDHISLDFPGSQALSATDLIQASSMYFHVVNETFSPFNPSIGGVVNTFLQGVWDEASFHSKTDPSSINQIAIAHLKKNNDVAKKLRELGLTLEGREGSLEISALQSKMTVQRGSSPKDWQGLSHPLLIVFHDPALEGSQLENIQAAYDPQRGNFLTFGVESSSQKNLFSWTSKYSKTNIRGTLNEAASRGQGWRMAVVLNDTVISSPTLNEAIKESASISGSFSTSEVQKLSADLKAGSLSFTPKILSEKNVSPELGSADRERGILATAFALLLVIGAMIAYYRFAGIVASIAVIFNLLILWATLQNLGATLTLAGLAGIILTVGMAIDANVLVFERIKEEQALGKNAKEAITAGYKRAFSAIVDSNVTTVIAALILLNFDAGPVKSFAMNLIIGIVSSMFTALFVTRVYFTFWAKNPKNTLLKMSNWIQSKKFDFLKYAKGSFATAILIIGAGAFFVFAKSSSLLGLDFTGGYALYLELDKDASSETVEKAFVTAGASTQDIQVQVLGNQNELRILLGQSMESEGKPFYQLPLEREIGKDAFLFEKNPRIAWVVKTLESSGLSISEKSIRNIQSDWTAVSGQMSTTMRNSAALGLLLSFIAIFIYLAFRFEYKFAAAAVVCVIHDTLITVALMALLHTLGVPVQIDLITIAAIMTVIGYSLNDTIIIFDRIREELHESRRPFKEIINSALNFTLSRTMITSGSTLLVLLALLILGGASIFGFALVMTLGVILGTLSSWFIAAPLLLFFEKREKSVLLAK